MIKEIRIDLKKLPHLTKRQRITMSRCQGLTIITAMFLISIPMHHTIAEDFNTTFREYLDSVCMKGLFQSGSNLDQTCTKISGGGGPVNNLAIPAGVDRIEQRLQSVWESKERLGKTSGNTYAMNSGEQFMQSAARQLPPAGGTSPDIVFGLGSGVSVFFSAGAYALDHHQNRFEDGYEAEIPTVTVGADYRINDWLLAGLALNYTNYDGTYDNRGGFDKHIFGPLLYATFLPFEGAFADVVLGYARQENRNNRFAFATSCGLPGQPGRSCAEGEEQKKVEGYTSADYSENQYIASILTGYDQPFGNVTIGPRLGLAVSYEDFGSIKEEGDTGLELQYNNLDQTSVQSSLGVQASILFETAYGIVVPQAAVAWVHEYANNDRNIDAQLVEAPTAGSFTFQREPPARDWASIGLGISALLPNDLQLFVQFTTIQGNKNFVSYGGTAGVRLGL